MTDYSETVKALRHCTEADDGCATCERWVANDDCGLLCKGRLLADAAAAIEELDAEETRLLLITSELQDKLMDAQAEVKRLEPKRGEWIWIQKANGGQYKGCSVCHAPIPTDSMMDYLDDEDCDFCYSCGAKMEVQE